MTVSQNGWKSLSVNQHSPPNNGNRTDCGVSRHEQAHADPHPRSLSAELYIEIIMKPDKLHDQIVESIYSPKLNEIGYGIAEVAFDAMLA